MAIRVPDPFGSIKNEKQLVEKLIELKKAYSLKGYDKLDDLIYNRDKKATKDAPIRYLRQIVNSRTKDKQIRPSRKKLIKYYFDLKYSDYHELDELLKGFGYSPIYTNNIRDLLIGYCLKTEKSLDETNRLLMDFGFSGDTLFVDGYARNTVNNHLTFALPTLSDEALEQMHFNDDNMTRRVTEVIRKADGNFPETSEELSKHVFATYVFTNNFYIHLMDRYIEQRDLLKDSKDFSFNSRIDYKEKTTLGENLDYSERTFFNEETIAMRQAELNSGGKRSEIKFNRYMPDRVTTLKLLYPLTLDLNKINTLLKRGFYKPIDLKDPIDFAYAYYTHMNFKSWHPKINFTYIQENANETTQSGLYNKMLAIDYALEAAGIETPFQKID